MINDKGNTLANENEDVLLHQSLLALSKNIPSGKVGKQYLNKVPTWGNNSLDSPGNTWMD